MAEYRLLVKPSATKEIEAIGTKRDRQQIVRRIQALAAEPRPAGCRKLEGERNLWRVRIGDYRVVYAVYDDERRVDIVAVRHRSKAYE